MQYKNPISFSLILLTIIFVYSCSPDLPKVPPINATPTNEFHPGKFVWRDLMTDDVASVQKFYSGLFGWTFKNSEEGSKDYIVVLQNGVPIAGIFDLKDTKVEHKYSQWVSYVSVADMNQAINYTKQSGGTIYREPFNLPNRGSVAFILDSQNAVLAFVKSSADDTQHDDPLYDRWMWTELWTNNIDNSGDFYSELFGYDIRKFNTSVGNLYYVFQKENKPRAGMLKIPYDNVKPHWMPYIAVKDPAEIVKKVEELGGTIYLGLDDTGRSDAAIIADPSGAVFTIQKWPLEKGRLNEVKDE